MFFQQLIIGITIGSIYGLIALGYSMIYGILRFINFAHGDIFMWGAFFGLVIARHTGLSFPFLLVLTMILSTILGIVVERLVYKPLRGASGTVVTVAAIGLSMVLSCLALVTLGAETFAMPQNYSSTYFKLGGTVISSIQLFIPGTAILLMIFLSFFIYKTKYGKAIRAVAEDRSTASLMGINVNRTISIAFALGSSLGGAAGLLVGMYYDAVYFTMGQAAGIKAFTAAVLGGIGSIPGAMVGGLVLGVVENFGAVYISSNYRDAIAFVVLVLVLLIKPSGIFNANIYDKKA